MINYISSENKFYLNKQEFSNTLETDNNKSNNQKLKEINLLFNKIHEKFTNFDYNINRKKEIKIINREINNMLYKLEDLTDYFQIMQNGLLEINNAIDKREL